jgi:DNA polymerase-3 subunit delta'
VCPAGSEIRVEEIDQPVVSAAARTPFEARRRVFILEGAHAMTEAAANRMLKTLEEPPAFAHLLLLTDRPGEVLETIASRCQQVRFDPLTVDAMAALLEAAGVEPREARACAALALGDGERARALATEEGRALRARAQELATAALDGELAARPWAALVQEAGREGERAVAQVSEAAAAEQEFLSTKDRRRHERETTERARRAGRRATTGALDHVLQLTGLWFRDLACVAEGASELALNADRAEELARAAQGRPPARLRNAVELVEDTRQCLVLNVAHELACEALTYRLARELAAS